MSDTAPTEAVESAASALAEGAPALRAALDGIELAPGGKLVPISSFAQQADLVPLIDLEVPGRLFRVGAAAVGLAWRGQGKPKAKYEGDPMAYGGQVLDELVARGIPLDQIMQAGTVLLMLCAADFTRTASVLGKAKEVAGFSGARAAP